MEKDNLKLWHSVEKTNPNYTKKAKVGGVNITAIAPQYQIMQVTEKFGVYGEKWGFKDIKLSYDLVDKYDLVVFRGTFFFPNGEFEIINSCKLYINNAKTMIDDNFAKKVETDSLTKAISKLGFNADIFLGKFDDVRYLEEVTKEFAPQIDYTRQKNMLKACTTLEQLANTFKGFTGAEQKATVTVKDEMKLKLK